MTRVLIVPCANSKRGRLYARALGVLHERAALECIHTLNLRGAVHGAVEWCNDHGVRVISTIPSHKRFGANAIQVSVVEILRQRPSCALSVEPTDEGLHVLAMCAKAGVDALCYRNRQWVHSPSLARSATVA